MLTPVGNKETTMFEFEDDTTSAKTANALFGTNYEVELPDDYLHILNCVVEYKALKTFKCYDENDAVHFGAIRLTADMYSQIINNYYMRPMYKRPYYYINNYNKDNNFPTKDSQKPITFTGSNNIEREGGKSGGDDATGGKRYGNKSKVRMEIRYGKDNATFQLQKIYIDYLKAPQHIRLTQKQVDEVEDKSQELEFPDYISQEIVNELIKLLMENASDPRLQTNIPVNQTIAGPAQQEQPRR